MKKSNETFHPISNAWIEMHLAWELEMRKSSSSSRQNEPIVRTSTRFPESLTWRMCIVWYRSETIANKSSYKKTPMLWAKLIKSLWKTFSSSTTPSSNLILHNKTRMKIKVNHLSKYFFHYHKNINKEILDIKIPIELYYRWW